MSPAPTESRIFANVYSREARRLERLHSNHLAPGAATWVDATMGLVERMKLAGRKGGPTKAAAVLKEAGAYLLNTQEESMHFLIGAYNGKRTAVLQFATQDFGKHPLLGLDEDGVNIRQHFIYSRRGGSGECYSGANLGYVSRHAIERMHERTETVDIRWANAVFASIGLLGFLLDSSDRHADRGVCLHLGDTLAVGVIRDAVSVDEAKRCYNRFFEVRTMLPVSEVEDRNPTLVEQGRQTADVLSRWVEGGRDLGKIAGLVEHIPDLQPRDDDYVARYATKVAVGVSA